MKNHTASIYCFSSYLERYPLFSVVVVHRRTFLSTYFTGSTHFNIMCHICVIYTVFLDDIRMLVGLESYGERGWRTEAMAPLV